MPARAATVMSAGDGTEKTDAVAETEVTATVVPSFMLSAWTTSGDLTAAFNEEALVVVGGSVVVVVVVAGDDAIDVVVEGISVCDEEVAEMIEVEDAGDAEVEFDDDDVFVVVVIVAVVVVVVVFGTIVSVLVLFTECD